jgi:glycosyltransferase involved in cell wall biosynthesis
MRILFTIDTLTSGGKERRLVELMKALKLKPGVEFELAVMSNDIHYQEVFNLDINIHYVIRKRKKDVSVFNQFYKVCKNYKPDIVHCWDSMSAVYVLPSCKLLHIKFVNGIVADAPEKRNIFNKYWLRAKLTFPFSNTVVGNSRAGLAAYSAPKNKSICIHNGFNFKRTENNVRDSLIREQLGIHTKSIIGMVASFSKNKDYKTYFIAAQLLLKKRNDITFLAIGNDTDSILAKELISSEFIEYFRLLGRKSGIESFINAMDICVLSTFTEGISNSILEYMALGKPVIATSGGGTNEIVEDKKTGFLINPSNPAELADRMETLLNDTELRNKMGLAGKERIQNYFSIDKMADQYISVYKDSLISKKKHGEWVF